MMRYLLPTTSNLIEVLNHETIERCFITYLSFRLIQSIALKRIQIFEIDSKLDFGTGTRYRLLVPFLRAELKSNYLEPEIAYFVYQLEAARSVSSLYHLSKSLSIYQAHDFIHLG